MVARRRRKYRPGPEVEEGITMTERGAVRVKFPERPDVDLLDELKDAGFRFNRKSVSWVQKATEENVEIANAVWTAYQNREVDDA